MKAISTTTIRLGLINLPVQVCKATETTTDTSYNQAGPGGEKLRQGYFLPDGTECPKADIQKGIFQGENFYPISATEIESIKDATKLPDLNVSDVVDASEFWDRADRITGKYYVQMAKKGGSANSMRLFVEALEQMGKVMVTKWTPRSRQELLVLWPKDGILHASSVEFGRDMRESDETVRAHLSGTYTEAEMDMAKQLLTALSQTTANSLDMELDEALPMKHSLISQAMAGEGVEVAEKATVQPIKNEALADALSAALAAAKVAA